MKKLIYSIALVGLVVMAACSGDSPTANPVPTVVPDEWAITSLTVSDASPYIGSTVLVEAIVQQNGGEPPNGTTVRFTASGGQFVNGTTQASVGTQSGRAAVQFTAASSGGYVIEARVRGVTRQVSVTFRDPNVDEDLVIHLPLIPDTGSFDGGETVILRGTGIRSPVEVFFEVANVLYQAQITRVIESEPLAAPGQIEIVTPAITMVDRSQPRQANVTVRRGVGTSAEQMVTLPSAFTFVDVIQGGPPTVYALEPPFGDRQGGDQINVLGRNFEDATRATFVFRGNQLTADILTIAPDGMQMVISTPRFSATALTESEFADFFVDSPSGQSNTLTQAFLVVADDPTPEIASISPIAGPLGGGTLVTIFGSGFHVPVQVKFGNLTATDVTVIDDQSPADQDVITAVSPDYSQQGGTPPITVEVTVTNMLSGRTSNSRQFIYGDNLYISGNSPTEGRPGDQVLVFGSGFEDPLQLSWANNQALDVLSVSGTEIAARFPSDMAVTCSDRTGAFTVRLIESNQTTSGGFYNLLGNTPTVIDVDPTFVTGDVSGNYVTPSDITITGADFADTLLVRINQFVMGANAVTVIGDDTIEVIGIPAPNQFGLIYNTTPCTTPDGLQGLRKAPTPVDVTVVNLPGNCADTLVGGLIYEPADTTCVASAVIGVVTPVFPAAEAGTCEAASLVVNNTGAGTLEVYQMNLQGPFYFDGSGTNQTGAGFQVAPFGSSVTDIYFCPETDNGLVQNGNLTIQNSSPTNPLNVALSGQEAFPVLGVSTNNVDFGAQTAGTGIQTQPLSISNSGPGSLSWSLSGATSTVFLRSGPGNPVNSGTIASGGSANLEVALNTDSGATGPVQVFLTITAAEPDAQGSPQTIEVVGTIN